MNHYLGLSLKEFFVPVIPQNNDIAIDPVGVPLQDVMERDTSMESLLRIAG